MKPHEIRQLSLQYSFPFKFFELLQFGATQLLANSTSFSSLFSQVKEINLFSLSRLYLDTFPENGSKQDVFANYLIHKIDAEDYIQVQFADLIEDYQFLEECYDLLNTSPYWKTTPQFIEPRVMHDLIQSALQLHVSNASEIYRFINPHLPEKYGLGIFWEELQHYICINWEKQTIQLVTSGFG